MPFHFRNWEGNCWKKSFVGEIFKERVIEKSVSFSGGAFLAVR
jgi:hypothetical protein